MVPDISALRKGEKDGTAATVKIDNNTADSKISNNYHRAARFRLHPF